MHIITSNPKLIQSVLILVISLFSGCSQNPEYAAQYHSQRHVDTKQARSSMGRAVDTVGDTLSATSDVGTYYDHSTASSSPSGMEMMQQNQKNIQQGYKNISKQRAEEEKQRQQYSSYTNKNSSSGAISYKSQTSYRDNNINKKTTSSSNKSSSKKQQCINRTGFVWLTDRSICSSKNALYAKQCYALGGSNTNNHECYINGRTYSPNNIGSVSTSSINIYPSAPKKESSRSKEAQASTKKEKKPCRGKFESLGVAPKGKCGYVYSDYDKVIRLGEEASIRILLSSSEESAKKSLSFSIRDNLKKQCESSGYSFLVKRDTFEHYAHEWKATECRKVKKGFDSGYVCKGSGSAICGKRVGRE